MSRGPCPNSADSYLVERVNSRSSFRPLIWAAWWARDEVTPIVLRRREGIAEFRALLAAHEPVAFRKVS